jgi:hypothetical protein
MFTSDKTCVVDENDRQILIVLPGYCSVKLAHKAAKVLADWLNEEEYRKAKEGK